MEVSQLLQVAGNIAMEIYCHSLITEPEWGTAYGTQPWSMFTRWPAAIHKGRLRMINKSEQAGDIKILLV